MPGARCTRGLVCHRRKKIRTRAYRAAEASDIPCAMALRLISCSPRSGRARCHRRRRNCFHQLDASIGASGPHDFTVRIRTLRQRHIRVHRIPSRACDDRETPLVSGRDQTAILLIWRRRQVKFGKSEILSGAANAVGYRRRRENTFVRVAHALTRMRRVAPMAKWRGRREQHQYKTCG